MALKSENQLYEQYLLPRAVGKIINGQTAKIYDTCQADIIFAVDDYRKDYALWRTHYVTRVQQLFVTDLGPEQKKNMAHQLVSMYNFAFETFSFYITH
jgi:flagellin-specific chaperone FliS